MQQKPGPTAEPFQSSAAQANDNSVAILVVSCDAYRDLWRPFFHCFFKYWPDCPYPIYLGSNFVSYQDSRVIPILVGTDVDYSSNLLKMLESIKQEYVLLWIEDRVLTATVDTIRIENLITLVKAKRAAYLKLISIYPFALSGDTTQEIGEIPKGKKYRVGVTVALWKKQVLLSLLRPGETAWDIERQGSIRSNAFDEGFFSLSFPMRDSPPLSDLHLLMRGRLLRNTASFLERERLTADLSGRQLQSFRSYLYFRAYGVFFGALSYLKWNWARLSTILGQ
jgi:hypothetical protein